MLKKLKKGNCYLIINCDEPYIKKVFKILVDESIKKKKWNESTIFKNWFKETFKIDYKNYIAKGEANE